MKMYANMCICKFPHAVQDRAYVNKDQGVKWFVLKVGIN